MFPLRCDLGYIATSQPILQVGCDVKIAKFRENEYKTYKFLLKNLERLLSGLEPLLNGLELLLNGLE